MSFSELPPGVFDLSAMELSGKSVIFYFDWEQQAEESEPMRWTWRGFFLGVRLTRESFATLEI